MSCGMISFNKREFVGAGVCLVGLTFNTRVMCARRGCRISSEHSNTWHDKLRIQDVTVSSELITASTDKIGLAFMSTHS